MGTPCLKSAFQGLQQLTRPHSQDLTCVHAKQKLTGICGQSAAVASGTVSLTSLDVLILCRTHFNKGLGMMHRPMSHYDSALAAMGGMAGMGAMNPMYGHPGLADDPTTMMTVMANAGIGANGMAPQLGMPNIMMMPNDMYAPMYQAGMLPGTNMDGSFAGYMSPFNGAAGGAVAAAGGMPYPSAFDPMSAAAQQLNTFVEPSGSHLVHQPAGTYGPKSPSRGMRHLGADPHARRASAQPRSSPKVPSPMRQMPAPAPFMGWGLNPAGRPPAGASLLPIFPPPSPAHVMGPMPGVMYPPPSPGPAMMSFGPLPGMAAYAPMATGSPVKLMRGRSGTIPYVEVGGCAYFPAGGGPGSPVPSPPRPAPPSQAYPHPGQPSLRTTNPLKLLEENPYLTQDTIGAGSHKGSEQGGAGGYGVTGSTGGNVSRNTSTEQSDDDADVGLDGDQQLVNEALPDAAKAGLTAFDVAAIAAALTLPGQNMTANEKLGPADSDQDDDDDDVEGDSDQADADVYAIASVDTQQPLDVVRGDADQYMPNAMGTIPEERPLPASKGKDQASAAVGRGKIVPPQLNASDPIVSPGRITLASKVKAARLHGTSSNGNISNLKPHKLFEAQRAKGDEKAGNVNRGSPDTAAAVSRLSQLSVSATSADT